MEIATSVLLVFIASSVVVAGVGFPADRLRRSAAATDTAAAATFVNVAALIVTVGLAAHYGLLTSSYAAPALVGGFLLGSFAADQGATRLWGPAHA